MKKIVKNICCIGAGYVGGPSMAVIAHKCKEIKVTVVDINEERINAWNDNDLNNLPIFEPGLKEIIKECRGVNLFFSNEIKKTISESDMVFLSVNTPTKSRGIGAGKASDLSFIESSAREISKYAKGHTIIVEKSTIPVRTAQTIKEILTGQKENELEKQKKSFSVLSNPEFLAEGTAINDLLNPDRILIGGEDPLAIDLLSKIYEHWVPSKKIITTNLWSSELSKLVANAFLAQRISSINSISALCESTGADIAEVSKAIGLDSRIGSNFLKVGPGFGGSCFKKDILNLIYLCEKFNLVEVSNYWAQILSINSWQQKRIAKIIVEKLFGTISGKTITVLGFSYKANTNDIRESPSIDICLDLIEEGAKLNIYDPKVEKKEIEKIFNQKIKNKLNTKINCSESINEASFNSDAVLIMTEWDEFKEIDWDQIYPLMRSPSWIFDTRRILDKENIDHNKFNIWSIGS
tara:strand:+ start:252 stop:1646 length:1395 start_codon:yes stop_codon:yes gene_type:complete